MYIFISVLILVASLLMVLIVLVQNSKGGGLSAGVSSYNQVMGVRKTTDFLEKATWGLAGTILFLCIVAAAFVPKVANGDQSEVTELINDATVVDPNLVAPGFDTQSVPAQEQQGGQAQEQKQEQPASENK